MGTLLGSYVRDNQIEGLLWPALGSHRIDPGLAATVVRLREVEGMGYLDIGKQLDISDVWGRQVYRRKDDVLSTPADRPVTPNFLRQQVWGPAMASLGHNFVFKDFRNTCVVNLIDGVMTGEAVPPKDVMRHVDHKSLRMTLDTYYQFRPQGRIGSAEPPGLSVEEALATFDPTSTDDDQTS